MPEAKTVLRLTHGLDASDAASLLALAKSWHSTAERRHAECGACGWADGLEDCARELEEMVGRLGK